MARQIVAALFAELPTGRRREVMSAVAHYIAGVLPWEPMAEILESLSRVDAFQAGDRVKTLRGSTRGVIIKVLEDGRVVWRPDASSSELMALPESLCADFPKEN